MSADKIDDAVGNDDINGIVGQRDVLNFTLQKFDVLNSCFALVLVRQSQHFIGHVETVGFASRPHSLGREQNIDAATRAKIEDNFTGIQFGQGSGIAAAQRRKQGFFGNLARLSRVVEVGSDWITATGGGAAPQHELPPLVTRRAACPYFSFTTSLMSALLM